MLAVMVCYFSRFSRILGGIERDNASSIGILLPVVERKIPISSGTFRIERIG